MNNNSATAPVVEDLVDSNSSIYSSNETETTIDLRRIEAGCIVRTRCEGLFDKWTERRNGIKWV